ncbi:Uncharacterised protein g8604 [Pycnogonum litorale]
MKFNKKDNVIISFERVIFTNEMNSDDWNVIMNGAGKVSIGFSGMRFNCSSCALIPVAKKMAITNEFPCFNALCSYPDGKRVKDIRIEELKYCN